MAARAKKKADKGDGGRDLAVNRQARRDYEVEETFEAGIELLGSEVKSCRDGRIQLKDSFAKLRNGQLWLMKCHISPYTHAPSDAHELERPRRLLLHRHQLRRLIGKTQRTGYTLIPLRVYLKGAWIKVEIALARGRAKHEKRDVIKKKIHDREIRQAMR